MTRPKKSAPKKKRSTSKTQSRPANRLMRFMRAFVVAGIAGFSAGTYFLNPQWDMPSQWRLPSQWQLPASAKEILAHLGWPWERLTQGAGQGTSAQTAPAVKLSGPSVQTQFFACPQFFPSQHPPIVPATQGLRELCFSGFAILHSGQTKTPVFVAERLNRQLLTQAQGLQRTDKFYSEARLPQAERADLDDYKGSGYSRGHMAPAADMYSSQTMAQSFSLANMVPQDQTHNAGPWSRIEQDTRKYVMRASGDVYLFTGPVYTENPKAIGDGVAIPAYLYKLVYDATTGRSWAYWQANSASTKAGPPITYDELVKRTGIQFLPTRAAGTASAMRSGGAAAGSSAQ
ncbi:DNA/RNA non-specific endonuclease [Bordetella genomosp. 4]|uniref:Endonuclease n=1 Tax=Bordetella genomosp. 4 TaxID=463044 RepID=A0A261U4N3_9BORD|nr:endonuclease [Bordetella genomosp. 4]OZI56575.1 endonuclease [Bordetella genomosp. 4]